MNPLNEKPRWVNRFDNYKRAFLLLREGIEAYQTGDLSQLEKEGIIQRFEYTWELGWKVLKDYLEYKGIVFDTITPVSVIRAAYKANVIENGDVWMAALNARNKMSHTYNFKTFERTIEEIHTSYLAILDQLFMTLMEEAIADQSGN